MTALLITVSSPNMVRIRRTRYIRFQQCTMPYLAAHFPPNWEIDHVDEECEQIDFSRRYDLVALTFHTPSAPHAYEIADRFRQMDCFILMGGPHVTLMPDEAAEHADAVFVGEAEETLPRFLAHFEQGSPSLHGRYVCEKPPLLNGLPMSHKELFHRRDHAAGILCATRGCPNHCEFCTLARLYGRSFRRRPIAEVAAEFASFHGKVVIFWDDNLSADMDYAKDLFRAIRPARKWWSSQAAIQAALDDEFLELAAASGCQHLFFGLESISQASLDSAGKAFNQTDMYYRLVRRVHAHGIGFQAGIVFGFDSDTPAIFNETSDFLEEAGVQNATLNILTPYPGTPLFNRLESEGRILTRDWSKYNSRADVVFQPKNMSPETLLEGFWAVNQRFYSLKSILTRSCHAPPRLLWELPLNLMYSLKWARYAYSKWQSK
ncbi:MAG: B12-binding domain-containing radical SAM protein [Clostridiales bacterium]|nr:B12-binding domain-containing radical SAM protein [Clostridiales bacterium]